MKAYYLKSVNKNEVFVSTSFCPKLIKVAIKKIGDKFLEFIRELNFFLSYDFNEKFCRK